MMRNQALQPTVLSVTATPADQRHLSPASGPFVAFDAAMNLGRLVPGDPQAFCLISSVE
jgi:hypothetical protein